MSLIFCLVGLHNPLKPLRGPGAVFFHQAREGASLRAYLVWVSLRVCMYAYLQTLGWWTHSFLSDSWIIKYWTEEHRRCFSVCSCHNSISEMTVLSPTGFWCSADWELKPLRVKDICPPTLIDTLLSASVTKEENQGWIFFLLQWVILE